MAWFGELLGLQQLAHKNLSVSCAMNRTDISRLRIARYKSNRGGHPPGHLRTALSDGIEDAVGSGNSWWEHLEIFFHKKAQQEMWERLSHREQGRWLIGQLWNCTDTVPGSTCEAVDVPIGSSYARLVRKVIEDLE